MSSPSFIETSSKRCEQRAGLGDALVDVLLDGLGRIELRLLRQVADLEARRRPRLAEELLVDARHDAEQRALAGAVVAEHADLGARDRTTARSPSRISRLGGTSLRRSFITNVYWAVMARRLYPCADGLGYPRRGAEVGCLSDLRELRAAVVRFAGRRRGRNADVVDEFDVQARTSCF